ncbi:VOC family protein [Gymnodinialimonas sp. 2305UL16-5]|uniref:VOC family protein n=1 Tax=Gymnodinialimonas mytili TaxID=3126503 RepID=UPI0030A923B8
MPFSLEGGAMGKVIGVGGVFFACADPGATKDWYVRVLGLEATDFGGFMFSHETSAETCGKGAMTIFAPFDAKADYFKPSDLPFMINLMVDDLDAVLTRCKDEGVDEVQPAESHEYGRFAWIMDPDERKIELWQPIG